MTTFLDGPAKGVVLWLQRAPLYLRAVRKGEGTAGKWDALDLLDDAPEPGETIFAYRLVGAHGMVHIDRTVKGRRVGSWHTTGEYRLVESQPGDATMRDRAAWRAWCEAEHAKAGAG